MYGRVTALTAVALGDEVAVAASIGATSLVLDDLADFDEDGGWLRHNGTLYEYVSGNDDTATLTLVGPGLTAAAAPGDRVDVWDPTANKGLGGVPVDYEADIVPDDDVTGDPLQASVDHSLAPLLFEAIRSEGSEAVELREDGDDLRVVNVLGKVAKIDTDEHAQVGSLDVAGSATVGTTLTTQELEATDGTSDFHLGPQGASGSPGLGWTVGGVTGWLFVDPSTHIVTIQADVTDSTKGTIQLNLAAISGPAVSFVGKTQATGELHGQTVWVDSVPTTSNAANTNMGTSGQLQKSTSSRRYKKAIKDAVLDLDAVLAMRPRSWVSKNAEDGTGRYVGFIAEEVDELGLTELVVYDDDHRPDGFAYPTLVTHLTALCQQQQTRIDDLTRRLEALEQGA